ncbi:MAG: hypothetical protein AB1Z57_00285 [Acidimicrobiia bacterium]
MRKTLVLALAVLTVLAVALPAAARSERAPVRAVDAIYADGEAFGTILLGSIPAQPGQEHAFDTLYLVTNGAEGQKPVAETAPGPGYNGGRWLPTEVTWHADAVPTLLTSSADVLMYAQLGLLTIGAPNHDAAFICPLVP